MLSSRIIELEERCLRTERETKAYAPKVAEAFAAQFRRCLTDEEKARFPDVEDYLALVLHVIGVRMVGEVRREMTGRDRADRRARKAHREECRRRDAANGGLYDCVVEIRRRCKTHLTPREERLYLMGLSGETPRQPFVLTRWADALDETLENVAFPVEAKKFDPAPYLRDLRNHHAAVTAAIDAVAEAHRETQETGHQRKLAFERCGRVHLRCSQVVEALLAFVKREDLARDLRGVGRRGRPTMTTSQASVDDTLTAPGDVETAELAPGADSRPPSSHAEPPAEPPRQPRDERDTSSTLSRVLKTARERFSKG